MKCRLIIACLFLSVCVAFSAFAAQTSNEEQLPVFTLHRLGTGSGPTLLIIGGIRGDEPGGFSAASLFATHYSFTSGSVWVVPNLNFPSIIFSSRGLHGDMNRKFANLSASDPEYETVRRVQSLITQPQVDLVLNMHDGSGFYRKKWQSRLINQHRWGQCIVIDQAYMDAERIQNPRFANLQGIAQKVANDVNKRLLKPLHSYRIKNTTTRNYDHEMEKTLSYYAICNGKAAFGLEASKELTPLVRIYYHIGLVEGFMKQMGIKFTRNFELSPEGVLSALNENIFIRLYKDKMTLPLDNIRPLTAGYIPVQANEEAFSVHPSNPLMAVVRSTDKWRIVYGNQTLTEFTPEIMAFDHSLHRVSVLVDGKQKELNIGETLHVRNNFIIKTSYPYRVNAIGAKKDKNGTEAGQLLQYSDFAEEFSLDRSGKVYRVEFYKGNAFSGMILVNFASNEPVDEKNKHPLTAFDKSLAKQLGR